MGNVITETELNEIINNNKFKGVGKTGYKGIDLCKTGYRIRKVINGKRETLGIFKTLDEALEFYKNNY